MNIFINPEFQAYYKGSPIRLVDIGASGGLQKNWKKASPHLQVISFEPDSRSSSDQQKDSPRNIYLKTALFKEKTKVDFNCTRHKLASSILSPNSALLREFPESERFAVIDRMELDADTLDNQLEQNKVGDIDFIKLDAQGAELFILEGASRSLKSALGLEIEVEFIQIYDGQPLFYDVDKFMRERGFCLFDLRPYYWKREVGRRCGGLKGQIVFADALYFADLKQVHQRLNQDKPRNKAKVLKAISLCILYGYLDYALAIFKQEMDCFSAREVRILGEEIRRSVSLSLWIPNFPCRGKLAGLLKGLYKVLRSHHNGWAISEEKLGNL